MLNAVIEREKLNVVGVWNTYDQIIPTLMDWLLCSFHNFNGWLIGWIDLYTGLIFSGPQSNFNDH